MSGDLILTIFWVVSAALILIPAIFDRSGQPDRADRVVSPHASTCHRSRCSRCGFSP